MHQIRQLALQQSSCSQPVHQFRRRALQQSSYRPKAALSKHVQDDQVFVIDLPSQLSKQPVQLLQWLLWLHARALAAGTASAQLWLQRGEHSMSFGWQTGKCIPVCLEACI